MRGDISKRWALRNGMWTGGFDSPAQYLQSRQYTMKGIVNKIRCPALVCDAEHDHVGVDRFRSDETADQVKL